MSENKDKANMEKDIKKPGITGNAVIACLVGIALIACIQIVAVHLNTISFIAAWPCWLFFA